MRELLHRLDSQELTEWIAYAQLEPFGEERADVRSAIVAMTTANVWGNKCKLSEFIPRWDETQRKVTPWQKVQAWCMGLAAECKGDNGK